VPWVQKEEFSEGEIEGLFVSKAEVEMVVKVLSQLKPDADKACEIQILSPYNNQLDEIRTAVNQAKSKGLLPDMFREPFDLSKEKRIGATVDEFQGSEADVVIVSLVRNNALVPWKSVGFLKEANRMNVLLSRARQKLCIIGSWDFFQTRCNEYTSADDEHAYIGRMMKTMREAVRAGRLAKVSHVS
jgi:superfamily I DNA and/or RNA helicase